MNTDGDSFDEVIRRGNRDLYECKKILADIKESAVDHWKRVAGPNWRH